MSEYKLNSTNENHIENEEIVEKEEKSLDNQKETIDEPTKPSIPFWFENPNILFNQTYIFEFFPMEDMTYNQKLNAITRTVIFLFILSFSFSQNMKTIVFTAITLFTIYLLHYYHMKELKTKKSKKISNEFVETFENPTNDLLKTNGVSLGDDIFEKPTSSNPLNNVLVSDYDYNVNKKPAPPAFNNNIRNEITEQVKKTVQELNPDQPNIVDKLYNNVDNNMHFEQSLRQFTTNPGSTIPNDQGAFADFCYGSMVSCKEGNQFACARNLSRHIN